MKPISGIFLFAFLLVCHITKAGNVNNTLLQKDSLDPKSACLQKAFRKFQQCIKNNDSVQLAKSLTYPCKAFQRIGLSIQNEADFKKYYSRFFNTYNKQFIQHIRFSDFSESLTTTSKSFLMYKDVQLNPIKSDDCEDIIYVSVDPEFRWFDFYIGNNVKDAKGNCMERLIVFNCVVDNSSCGFTLKKIFVL